MLLLLQTCSQCSECESQDWIELIEARRAHSTLLANIHFDFTRYRISCRLELRVGAGAPHAPGGAAQPTHRRRRRQRLPPPPPLLRFESVTMEAAQLMCESPSRALRRASRSSRRRSRLAAAFSSSRRCTSASAARLAARSRRRRSSVSPPPSDGAAASDEGDAMDVCASCSVTCCTGASRAGLCVRWLVRTTSSTWSSADSRRLELRPCVRARAYQHVCDACGVRSDKHTLPPMLGSAADSPPANAFHDDLSRAGCQTHATALHGVGAPRSMRGRTSRLRVYRTSCTRRCRRCASLARVPLATIPPVQATSGPPRGCVLT